MGLIGDAEGEGRRSQASVSGKNRQLRVFRGEIGVRGDVQPYVLIVLVGDSGGVLKPEKETTDSTSLSVIAMRVSPGRCKQA